MPRGCRGRGGEQSRLRALPHKRGNREGRKQGAEGHPKTLHHGVDQRAEGKAAERQRETEAQQGCECPGEECHLSSLRTVYPER